MTMKQAEEKMDLLREKYELIDKITNLVMDGLVRDSGYTDDNIDTWEDDAIYTQVHKLASKLYNDTLDEMACLESYIDEKNKNKAISQMDKSQPLLAT